MSFRRKLAASFRSDEIATDLGTVLNGYEAVEVGPIDEIGGIAPALRLAYRTGAKRAS